MPYTFNDNNDTIIVDSSGVELSVSQSQSTVSQSMLIVGGSDPTGAAKMFKTTTDGTIVVTGSFSAVSVNASIGGNNQNIPSSASLVGGSDGTLLRPLKVSSDGTLFITGSIATTSGTQNVNIIGTTVTQSITGTVLSLPFGIQNVTGTLHINNVLLPVSVSNFPNSYAVTGAVEIINHPVTQSVKLVAVGTNVTQSMTGSVTVNGLTFVSGSNLSVFITSSNVLPITGSVLALPTGVQTITGSISITMPSGSYGGKVEGVNSDSATITSNPILIGGADGSILREMSVDSLGRIITAPAGSSSAVTSSLIVGYITTSATTRVPVLATTLTEQTTNAQRSIVSANAADAAAGTGARTVKITYLDQSLNGPYTENITLNGTTPVDTTNTNICYIEKLEVLTVGSTGTNVGIISLKAATGGGGSTIVSIVATENRLFYALHYVPIGKTCYITGISVSHDGTTVGSGGVYTISSKDLSLANSAETIISDFVRQYGQASNTTRTWGTAIKINGPAKIVVYVKPESSSTFTHRAALDLYDQ